MGLSQQLQAARLSEGRRGIIGPGGIGRPSGSQLNIQPNRIVWMGASSSPQMVFITKVSDDAIRYLSYPFEDSKEHYVQKWIGQDLIAKGTETHLKHYAKYIESGLKRSLDDILAGKPGRAEKLSDWKRVYVLVKAAPGLDDVWRAAEEYGNVGGLGEPGPNMQYEIHTDNRTVPKIKADKRFTFVKTSSKPFG